VPHTLSLEMFSSAGGGRGTFGLVTVTAGAYQYYKCVLHSPTGKGFEIGRVIIFLGNGKGRLAIPSAPRRVITMETLELLLAESLLLYICSDGGKAIHCCPIVFTSTAAQRCRCEGIIEQIGKGRVTMIR
jgi:hypothetical protein